MLFFSLTQTCERYGAETKLTMTRKTSNSNTLTTVRLGIDTTKDKVTAKRKAESTDSVAGDQPKKQNIKTEPNEIQMGMIIE